MTALSAEQRAGLFVAVITGGRPRLGMRPTRAFLDELEAAGFSSAEWVLTDRDAERYDEDERPFCVYPYEWALDYARDHWMLPTPPVRDGFLGGFTGREWALLEAERRGCWGTLMLDDNILQLLFLRGTSVSRDVVRAAGGLGLYADVLGALALSTNARMVGAQLNAVIPSAKDSGVLVRAGFPYSLFVERTGPGRESWLGPFEEDITQAFQYGDRYDGATAAVVPLLTYQKEHRSKTGMRAAYDSTRSVALQRLIPHGASLGIRQTRSNGKGDPRVFHTMKTGAIRNPVRVLDRELYLRARDRVEAVRSAWLDLELAANRDKIRRRAETAAAKAAARETTSTPTV